MLIASLALGVAAVFGSYFSAPASAQQPETECGRKLEEFVVAIDGVLATNPRDINFVRAVLNRHFPLHGCSVEVVSGIVKKSRYFRSVSKNGPKIYVFSLNSETAFSRGVSVTFGVTDNGDTRLPFAGWSPPFL